MNVRFKLFGIMAALVLLVTAVYFGTTQGYLESRFGRFSATDIAGLLQTYYEENGNSWNGVGQADLAAAGRPGTGGGAALLSPQGTYLLKVGQADGSLIVRRGFRQAIRVKGVRVGTAYAYRWDTDDSLRLKDSIMSSMKIEGVRAAALTASAALLLGLWLAWKLTRPLKRLIAPIDRIAAGELDVRFPVDSRDEYGKVAAALNHMANQLLRAQETRKRLTADVAHELRTPLAIINSQLENIQNGGRSVPPETLLPIQDEVIRMTKMIGDLHQLALAESGALPLDRKPADLAVLLDGIIGKLEPELAAQKIRIVRTAAGAVRPVDIDSNRMTQVFYNLLSNAIRYTPSGGTIECVISEREADGSPYVSVSVTDTGIGVPEEELPFLFERFYRVEESRSRHTGGMGLGLAIAKEFVQAHGGFIEVKSKQGQGTTFVVNLPRQPLQNANYK